MLPAKGALKITTIAKGIAQTAIPGLRKAELASDRSLCEGVGWWEGYCSLTVAATRVVG